MDYFVLVLIFATGAAFGSFINVIALRHNTGLSYIKGESRCLSCNTLIPARHLVPILSFLFLRARCSFCKARFSLQYLLVEIISGLAFYWIYLNFGFTLSSLLLTTIYCLLSIIFIYDLRHKIIPDLFVFLFVLFSFIYSCLYLNQSIIYNLLSIVLIPLPFFFIWLFSKGRLMGFGDIKLMAGIGALLGLGKGISAVFISFWLGTAYVIAMYAWKIISKQFNLPGAVKNLTMKSELPFAPFLILATALVFLFQINLLKNLF